MNTLSSHSVVDQMTSELAERRRTSFGRRAAYVALAQAIVSDERHELFVPMAPDRQPTPIGQSIVAA